VPSTDEGLAGAARHHQLGSVVGGEGALLGSEGGHLVVSRLELGHGWSAGVRSGGGSQRGQPVSGWVVVHREQNPWVQVVRVGQVRQGRARSLGWWMPS
jgi:hypothetical protein